MLHRKIQTLEKTTGAGSHALGDDTHINARKIMSSQRSISSSQKSLSQMSVNSDNTKIPLTKQMLPSEKTLSPTFEKAIESRVTPSKRLMEKDTPDMKTGKVFKDNRVIDFERTNIQPAKRQCLHEKKEESDSTLFEKSHLNIGNDSLKVALDDTRIEKESMSHKGKHSGATDENIVPERASVLITDKMRQQIEERKREAIRRKHMNLAMKKAPQYQKQNSATEQGIHTEKEQHTFNRNVPSKPSSNNTKTNDFGSTLSYDANSEVRSVNKQCPLTPEQMKRIQENRERAKKLLRNNAAKKKITFSEEG